MSKHTDDEKAGPLSPDWAKHTPGPWKSYHENGSMGSGGHLGVEIASSDPLFQRTVAMMAQNNHLSGAEAAANARLIALAPEMAEFVRKVSEWRYPTSRDVIDAARALLARLEAQDGE